MDGNYVNKPKPREVILPPYTHTRNIITMYNAPFT